MAKTVVLLGAGASYASDFRLPTMRGFFMPDGVPENLEFLLGWFYDGVPREEFDLEEVFSYLDLSVRRLPAWIPDARVRDVFGARYPLGELLWYVNSRLKVERDKLCSKHVALFRRL